MSWWDLLDAQWAVERMGHDVEFEIEISVMEEREEF